jgi:hypothetical protein
MWRLALLACSPEPEPTTSAPPAPVTEVPEVVEQPPPLLYQMPPPRDEHAGDAGFAPEPDPGTGAPALDPTADLTLSPTPDIEPVEQLALERLNEVRADPPSFLPVFEALLREEETKQPAGRGCFRHKDLLASIRAADPRPPLAPHGVLREVALAHSRDMELRDYFGHTNPDGLGSNERVRRAGIALGTRTPHPEDPSRYYRYGDDLEANQLESLFTRSMITGGGPQPLDPDWLPQAVDSLILDRCIESLGHRKHLLGVSVLNAHDRQVGIGHHYATTQRSSGRSHGRYSLGEGLAGERVEAPELGLYTETNAAGGYTLPVVDGRKGTLRWGGQDQPYTIHGANLKLDFER